MHWLSDLIPFAFFGTVCYIVFVVFKHLKHDKDRRYALIEKAMDSGQTLPENMLAEPRKPEKRSFSYFKSGIIFTFLAAGLWSMMLLLCYAGGMSENVLFLFAFVGIFFTAFGLSWLLIGWLRKNQEKHEEKLDEILQNKQNLQD